MTPDELLRLEDHLTEAERAELASLLAQDVAAAPWRPLPGPQTMAYYSTASIVGYGGAAGGGKGLALDTPLPTPQGWTTMGAVQPGDELFGPDGLPCRVTGVSTISHRPCYRLRFDDGSVLVADDVHRWVTLDAKERAQPGHPGTLRTTAELVGGGQHAIRTTAILVSAADGWQRIAVERLRHLVACIPTPSVPTRCIAVDSPSRLYLAGEGMIATHNTDLAAGLILSSRERCLFVRREKAQTEGLVQRLTEIVGSTDGYSSQRAAWRLPGGGLLELAGLDNPGDERRWQGRAHALKCFDEVTEQREAQVRFVMGWNRTSRSVKAGAFVPRALFTFNPPTTTEGRWVVDFFGPWLDKKHPLYPTPPGVLRYAAMMPDGRGGSKDRWMDRPDRFVLDAQGEPQYDFAPADYAPEDIIVPRSRTFIPARLTDNPYYMESGYMSTLQSLPEPLRSQMLYGDFTAGVEDDVWQVIPTAWVEAAQARWRPRSPRGEMLQMGVDVARGGRDATIIATRHQADGHGLWIDTLQCLQGEDSNDGPKVASFTLVHRRDDAPINIDVIGVGASPYDLLRGANAQVMGINVAERATQHDASGRLSFKNLRSQLWWQLREALDPSRDTGITLPPDGQLRSELCAPKWSLSGMMVQVESREDIVKRCGHSPDRATAVMLALMDQPKRAALAALGGGHQAQVMDYDPLGRL